MFDTWQWIALVVIALLGGAVTVHFQRKAEAMAERLSRDDRQEFTTRYLNRGDRSSMPERFRDLAAASDRVRTARTGVTVTLALALLLFLL